MKIKKSFKIRYSLLLCGAIGCGLLSGQTAGEAPAFEVASVKPSSPQTRIIGMFTFPGGRITATLYTLEMLMQEAFHIQDFQISGGPSWVRDMRWDMEAKPPASSKASQSRPGMAKLPPNEEQRQMLQTLLADRFQLKVHRTSKEAPVYFLVKGDKELKLTAPKDPEAYPWAGSVGGGGISSDGIAGTNCSMEELAKRLSERVGRPVLDRTGLTGSYDFKYARGAEEQRTDGVSAIFDSVKALGLRLEAGKGPVEVVVIDHVEKPSAN